MQGRALRRESEDKQNLAITVRAAATDAAIVTAAAVCAAAFLAGSAATLCLFFYLDLLCGL